MEPIDSAGKLDYNRETVAGMVELVDSVDLGTVTSVKVLKEGYRYG